MRSILKGPEVVFGAEAAIGLAIVDPSAADVALEFRDRLTNERETRHTMKAMWRLGPAAKPAIPELIALLQGEHGVAAARVLGEIGLRRSPPSRHSWHSWKATIPAPSGRPGTRCG